MNLSDYIASFFLVFGNGLIIIPLLLWGLIFAERRLFYSALCLIGLSILVNVALKVSFQLPLSPSLGKEGFAFPSGHMQLATVFYGGLAYNKRSQLFSLLIVCLLAGIGWGLIHYNYHNLYDVSAAFIVALCLLYLYQCLQRVEKEQWILSGTASLLMVYIHLHYPPIPPHAWQAYAILMLSLLFAAWRHKKSVVMS